MKPIEAYPLQWPTGWTRTRMIDRRHATYRVTFARARDLLIESLSRFGARDIVISSNIALRRDGTPSASHGVPADPGIAVYWTHGKSPRVIACDCWISPRDNLRACGLTVDALRQIDRSGASQILERAFVGFSALPERAGDDGRPPWRDVFGVAPDAKLTLAQLGELYRRLALEAHPDVAGSHERMVELNRAREEAVAEIGL